jgi:hypothetical protein
VLSLSSAEKEGPKAEHRLRLLNGGTAGAAGARRLAVAGSHEGVGAGRDA